MPVECIRLSAEPNYWSEPKTLKRRTTRCTEGIVGQVDHTTTPESVNPYATWLIRLSQT